MIGEDDAFETFLENLFDQTCRVDVAARRMLGGVTVHLQQHGVNLGPLSPLIQADKLSVAKDMPLHRFFQVRLG